MALALIVGLAGVDSARAQTSRPRTPVVTRLRPPPKPPGKWRLEVYGGGVFALTSPGGDPAGSFPVGATFTTPNGSTSRAVSSWYFGDGAALFAQVQSQFATRYGQPFASIKPADTVLQSASARRGSGVNVGARVTGEISKRYSIEFGLDTGRRAFELESDAQDAIEVIRAGFETAFTGLLATVPQSDARVTSTAQIGVPGARQATITGALVTALSRGRRLSTHTVTGLGVAVDTGEALDVTLVGNYRFTIVETYPINETDMVTIHFNDRKSTVFGVFGAGFTYAASPRTGLRVDFRVLVGASGLSTTVEAAPSAQTGSPTLALPSNTTPSIQFSTSTASRSTLGGALSELTTFNGSGLDARGQLTAGYFFRF